MPHLPPVEITGGSLFLEVPVNEVSARGEVVKSLFELEQDFETYPVKGVRHCIEKDRVAGKRVAEAAYAEVADNRVLRREGANLEGYAREDQHSHSEKKRPNDDSRRYAIQRYTAVDRKAQIYLVEIYGENEKEMLEFRPTYGMKCSVKVYYAFEDEAEEVKQLMEEREWPRPHFEGHGHAPQNGGSGHQPDRHPNGRHGFLHAFLEWLRAFPKYVSMGA